MSNYLQKQIDPEGFSIEKLAKSYRAKLTEAEFDTKELFINQKISKQKEVSQNLFCKETFPLRKDIRNIHIDHWANRDFNEYLDIA